ncbi:TlpA disulfide reductase family protein [Terrarubrum flagellatum]|uniref:TlpA disulfide reductase family protein n=1 Tax=Terrirubrum flagellatum TaxID=2895980 RepID=UPI00314508AA
MIARRAPAARGATFWRVAAALAACAAAFLLPLNSDAAERSFRPWTGDASPRAFALSAVDGAAANLAAQRGRVVVLHFFATWCEPCREELPALGRFAERAGDAPLSILAISVAEPQSRVLRFLEGRPVNFPVLLDESRAASKALGITILPSTIVLDARLEPRLWVEGDFAWDGLAPRELIDRINAGEPAAIEN